MSERHHEYPTCAETHASLIVYSDELSAVNVTKILDLVPSRTLVPNERYPRQRHTWILSSRDHVESRDVREHVQWLLDRLDAGRWAQLRQHPCTTRLSIFWVSRHGHGGPIISVDHARRLGAYEIETHFDIYFGKPPDGDMR